MAVPRLKAMGTASRARRCPKSPVHKIGGGRRSGRLGDLYGSLSALIGITFDAGTFARGETWLCADAGGRVLGFFDLQLEDGIAEIYALFVEPDCKGTGIGRALWGTLEARAAALGAHRIGADSDPNAVPFYLRMGMEPAGDAPSGSIPGRRLPRLIKTLTGGLSPDRA